MLPVDNCDKIGVRTIVSEEELSAALRILGEESTKMAENWNKRQRENMDKLIYEKKPTLVLMDLSSVEFMDSSGLGLILGRYNEYRLDHITLVLVGVNKSVKKLFIISGINQLMDMYESVNIGG